MSDEAAPEAPRRLGPITIPNNFGPLMLMLVSAIAIGAVFWGRFGADVGIEIVNFDAGPTSDFVERGDGTLSVFADVDVYIVALEDGRLRAVDGRVEFSGCAVEYLPDDPRGRRLNPFGVRGVLEDPCSGAVWSVAGDAIALSNEPLRTPQLTFLRDEDGVQHVFVELITVGGD